MQIFKERAIAELYGVPEGIISDPDKLFEVAERVAEVMKFTVIDRVDHRFTPVGHTAGLLLAESHFIWHSWPQKEYDRHLSIDVYTCSPTIKLADLEDVIAVNYRPQQLGFTLVEAPKIRSLSRG